MKSTHQPGSLPKAKDKACAAEGQDAVLLTQCFPAFQSWCPKHRSVEAQPPRPQLKPRKPAFCVQLAWTIWV